MTLFLKLKDGTKYNNEFVFDLKHKNSSIATGDTFSLPGATFKDVPAVNIPNMSEQVNQDPWSLETNKGNAKFEAIDDLWIVCEYSVKAS